MKTCSKCGETKASEAFGWLFDREKPRLRSACKSCNAAEARRRNAENPDARRAAAKQYLSTHQELVKLRRTRHRQANQVAINAKARARYERSIQAKEAARAQAKRWRDANPSRAAERSMANRKKSIARLDDRYVRERLQDLVGSSVPRDSIPQEMIEAKREQLRLHRLAKEMQQAVNQVKESDHEAK